MVPSSCPQINKCLSLVIRCFLHLQYQLFLVDYVPQHSLSNICLIVKFQSNLVIFYSFALISYHLESYQKIIYYFLILVIYFLFFFCTLSSFPYIFRVLYNLIYQKYLISARLKFFFRCILVFTLHFRLAASHSDMR